MQTDQSGGNAWNETKENVPASVVTTPVVTRSKHRVLFGVIGAIVVAVALVVGLKYGKPTASILDTPGSGLVGWYALNETVSNADAVNNLSGYANLTARLFNGTAESGPQASPMVAPNLLANPGSLHFDAVDDMLGSGYSSSWYGNTGSIWNYDLSNYTISIWVRPDTIPTTSNQWLVYKGVFANYSNVNYSMWIGPGGVVRFGYTEKDLNCTPPSGSCPTSDVYVTSINTIAAGQWTLLTGSFDGTSLRLYINGQPVNIQGTDSAGTTGSIPFYTPTSGNRDPIVTAAGEYLLLGGIWRQSGHAAPNPYRYDGSMDDFRIYNRALTDGEVAGLFDMIPPTVTNVTSSLANGTYGPGQNVPIAITFSEAVTVTGSPTLTLETGTINRTATYVNGNGTNTLNFVYTVVAGDTATDLEYISTSALAGTIQDAAGNISLMTLPALYSASAPTSLGGSKNIEIANPDNIPPTVTSVTTTTPNGSYTIGATVNVRVNFSEAVILNCTPTVTLETGATDRTASYVNGDGTATLVFSYTVQAGDTSGDLEYATINALWIGSGTMKDAAGNNAVLTLPGLGTPNSLGGPVNTLIVIDTTTPTITTLTPANGSSVSSTTPINIVFSENVTAVAGKNITITDLTTGTTTQTIAATSTTIVGNTVTITPTTALLSETNYAISIDAGAFKDAATNGTTAVIGTSDWAFSTADTSGPYVTEVSSPDMDRTYREGEVIRVTVKFNEAVYLDMSGGIPTVELNLTNTNVLVQLTGGDGTSTLTFEYTVGVNQVSQDLQYTGTSALQANGATLQDSSDNDATLALPALNAANSLAGIKEIKVDGKKPVVSSASAFEDVITINFDEPLDDSPIPNFNYFNVNVGGSQRSIASITIVGSIMTITLDAPVGAGDSVDISYTLLIGELDLISDLAGNTANNFAVTAANSTLDTTAPTLMSTTPVTNVHNINPSTTLIMNFSENVLPVAGGMITIHKASGQNVEDFDAGTSARVSTAGNIVTITPSAAFEEGQEYYVEIAGDAFKDGANNFFAGFSDTQTWHFWIADLTAPTVTSVTSTLGGTQGVGISIPITITFSEPVTVNGTPMLALANGGPSSGVATYISGNNTNVLTFNYTVQAGDSTGDLQYVSATSLSAGLSIKDAADNNADLTLPLLASLDSLAGSSAVALDGIAPTPVSGVVDDLIVTINLSESVTSAGTVPAGSFVVTDNTSGSPVMINATSVTLNGTQVVINLANPVLNASTSLTLTYTASVPAMVDAAGNGVATFTQSLTNNTPAPPPPPPPPASSSSSSSVSSSVSSTSSSVSSPASSVASVSSTSSSSSSTSVAPPPPTPPAPTPPAPVPPAPVPPTPSAAPTFVYSDDGTRGPITLGAHRGHQTNVITAMQLFLESGGTQRLLSAAPETTHKPYTGTCFNPEAAPVAANPVLSYMDVAVKIWFHDPVLELSKMGVVQGVKRANGIFFDPARPVNQAELAKMLLVLTDQIPSAATGKVAWYVPYLNAAVDLHFFHEGADTTPSRLPTRAETIDAVINAFCLGDELPAEKNPYIDVANTSSYKTSILIGTQLGIINGDLSVDGSPTGLFRPMDPVKRAELAKMVVLGIRKAEEIAKRPTPIKLRDVKR